MDIYPLPWYWTIPSSPPWTTLLPAHLSRNAVGVELVTRIHLRLVVGVRTGLHSRANHPRHLCRAILKPRGAGTTMRRA